MAQNFAVIKEKMRKKLEIRTLADLLTAKTRNVSDLEQIAKR